MLDVSLACATPVGQSAEQDTATHALTFGQRLRAHRYGKEDKYYKAEDKYGKKDSYYKGEEKKDSYYKPEYKDSYKAEDKYGKEDKYYKAPEYSYKPKY